jgi:phosphatidylglycerophosphate synthase
MRNHPRSKQSARSEAARLIAVVAAILALAVAGLTQAGQIGLVGLLGAAVVFGLEGTLVLLALNAPQAPSRFGAANGVTLVRAAITALLCGFGAEALLSGNGLATHHGNSADPWTWVLPLGALGTLVLDGVDGFLARRFQLETSFGARFDMEVDALLILALAMVTLGSGRTGVWVLAAGLLRYVFVAAGWIWPALAAPLPPSVWRKAACVFLGIALAAALMPFMPRIGAGILAGAGVLAVTVSFAVDTIWLFQRRPRGRVLAGVNE